MHLNQEQQKLVSKHLFVVEDVIKYCINTNESIQGMGWDDLYQSGCIFLCKAALKYDDSRSQFKTFAQACIKNGLLDICRKINRDLNMQLFQLNDIIPGTDDLKYADVIVASTEEETDNIFSSETIDKQLQKIKQNYGGITLKGIEALELRYKGFTGKEIAELYGVPTKHIFAWISRAKSKLNNTGDMKILLDCCK